LLQQEAAAVVEQKEGEGSVQRQIVLIVADHTMTSLLGGRSYGLVVFIHQDALFVHQTSLNGIHGWRSRGSGRQPSKADISGGSCTPRQHDLQNIVKTIRILTY
jgi:hypothetical protein